MSITGKWSGMLWGTNNGSAELQIVADGSGNISGRLGVFEQSIGPYTCELTGTVSKQGKIVATLSSFASHSVTGLPNTGKIEGTLDDAKRFIEGTWETDEETRGEFILLGIPEQAAPEPGLPAPRSAQGHFPTLFNKNVTLDSYRLDAADLKRISEIVCRGTNIPQPALTAAYKEKGIINRGHIHIGVESLLDDPSVPDAVFELAISANEVVTGAGGKTVVLTLRETEPNTIFVSGYDSVWVEGKAAEIESVLQNRKSLWARILRNYGPNLNSLIFLLMLGLLPSMNLRQRFAVIAGVFVVLLLLLRLWNKAVNTKVYIRSVNLPWYKRHENTLLAVATLLVGGVISYLIQRFVR